MTNGDSTKERIIEILQQAGIFELKHGEAIINMHEGHVQSIVVKERRYQHTPSSASRHIPT